MCRIVLLVDRIRFVSFHACRRCWVERFILLAFGHHLRLMVSPLGGVVQLYVGEGGSKHTTGQGYTFMF